MSAVLARIAQAAAECPQRMAVEYAGGSLSYGALWNAVSELSERIGDMTVQAVAIDLPDGPAWIIAHLACVKAGVPHVPIPPFFSGLQYEHALRDAGADTLLFASKTDPLGIRLMHLTFRPVPLPAGTSMITYTSGSTGAPKGVCLGQRGMEQVAQSLLQMLGHEVAARHLSVLPMAVLLEQVGGLYPCMLAHGTYLFSEHPTTHALEATGASSAIMVPEILRQAVHDCTAIPRRFPHLRFVAVGGAVVPRELLKRARSLGLPVYEGYGLTESASVVAVNTPKAHREGSVGRLLPHLKASRAPDGEILIHRPAMLGYTGSAEAPPAVYATGDIGSIDDDGFLSIEGRKKHVLITSLGRNVSPEWPESLLLAQAPILQAVVYGDGQASLSALIVAAPEASSLSLAEAVARANAQLPSYARIVQWQRVAPFTPANGMLTGTGRVRREAILNHYHPPEASHDFFRTACA